MASLASLFVDIRGDAAPLERTLGGVRGQLMQTDASMHRTGGFASQLFAGLGTQALMTGLRAGLGLVESLGAGLFRGVTGAAALTEAVNKAGVVFGPAAAKITGLADQMASQFGISRKTIIDAASNIGLIGEAAGLSQGAAADMGVEMAQLAADAMSFYDVPIDIALEKIRSGLVGEAEPMRQFGVLLTEARVANEALRLGLASTTNSVDEQDKVIARASLIRQGLARATGDLARTADSPSNRMRAIAGRTENFASDVGAALMPAFTAGLGIVESAMSSMGAFFEENKATVTAWATGIGADVTSAGGYVREFFAVLMEMATSPFGQTLADGIGSAFTYIKDTVVETVNTIGVIYRNWQALTEIAGLTIFQALADIPPVFSWLMDSALTFGGWFAENWPALIENGLIAAIRMIQNFGGVVAALFKEIAATLRDPAHVLTMDWSAFDPATAFGKLTDMTGATFTDVPALAMPELKLDHTETDRRIADLMAGIVDEEVGRAGPGATTAGAAVRGGRPVARAGPGLAPAAEKEPKARTEGLEAFSKRLQESAFGKDDTAKKQLSAQEKANDHLNKLVELATPRQAGNTAVFAA